MGSPPDWWRIVSAARFYNVAPWELCRQPSWWIDVAHETMIAEAHSAEMHRK